ncbi:MAG: hypothetical protein RSD87_04545 [Cellulosilyticaceae bacterium]
MKFIITDFKRGFTETTFLASVGISLAVLVSSLGYYLLNETTYESTRAFMVCQSLILPFIAPLLATLPYSNMRMLEEDSGYHRLLAIKGNRKNYDFKRFLTNGVIGGMAIALPLLLFAVICRVFSPYESVQQIVGIVILDFMFGFSYASIAYGLTFVNDKRYIPTVAPQVIYLLFIYAFPYLNLEAYYPPLSFAPGLLPSKIDGGNILMQFGVLIGLSLGLMILSKSYKWMKENIRRPGINA